VVDGVVEEFSFSFWLEDTIFRALPFVFELKAILDFIVNETTLSLKEFLLLEDLHAELFLVHCSILLISFFFFLVLRCFVFVDFLFSLTEEKTIGK
jgi:hypothetical protein